MSKKIVVAGAGHGGVIAAAKLAKEGFDVTVYEKKKRENIGHDWEDRFDFQTVLEAVEKDERRAEKARKARFEALLLERWNARQTNRENGDAEIQRVGN